MKYIKDINNFKKINEALDVYDFGVRSEDFNSYYSQSIHLLRKFTQSDIDTLKARLPDYEIAIMDKPGNSYGDYYLYLDLKDWEHWKGTHWILHYYGDYCYGIFRFENDDPEVDLGGKINWVEFCDELDPVITRLMHDKERLYKERLQEENLDE